MKEPKLIGWGYFLPDIKKRSKDLVSSEFAKELEEKFEVISRRFIPEGIRGVDMAKSATLEAAKRANIEPASIDMIIYATAFPDHQFPGNATFLQPLLGLQEKPALDLRAQQVGFIAAIDAACALIETSKYEKILVVGSDIHSTALNFTDEGMKIDFPFGDGCGAFIVSSKGDGPTISRPKLLTDSRFAFDYYVPLGSISHPRMTHEDLNKGLQYQRINWDKLWQFAMERLPEIMRGAAESGGFALEDAELIAIPQLKPSQISILAESLNIEENRFMTILPEVGNIGNAALPVAYGIIREQKREFSKAIFAGFGSGFSIGAFAIKT